MTSNGLRLLPAIPAAGGEDWTDRSTPAPGSPIVYDLRIATYPADDHDVDLAAATRLEMGLDALEQGHTPQGIASLAAIPEADWRAIVRRFPMLPDWIERRTS